MELLSTTKLVFLEERVHDGRGFVVNIQKKNRPFWLLPLLLPLALAGLAALALHAHAQDTSILRPPKGAKMALVLFEDLECPQCSRTHPLVEEASRTYKIPVVGYDFPLPQHSWAFEAAVLARYFDIKPGKLGDRFRDTVFQHQQEINSGNLHAFAAQFAAQHKVTLPFNVDPQGRFAAAIRRDQAVGQRVGINHTPTLYVVTISQAVEVADRSQLYQIIDELKARP